MATARIAAGLVLTAARKKHAEIEAACDLWRAAEIEKVRAEPKVEGPFWRRTVTYLTVADAELEYDRLVRIPHTQQWWDRGTRPATHLGFVAKAQQLARAAMPTAGGDGYVMLNEDEVRILELGTR